MISIIMTVYIISVRVFMFIVHSKMFLPDHLAHDAENEFMVYGFKYKSMAHWIVIQARAAAGKTFRHYFDKDIKDLPTIHRANADVIKEGLNYMLPPMKYHQYEYAHTNSKLGIGTTRLRLRFGEPALGDNVYGKCVSAVLKEREELHGPPDLPEKPPEPDTIPKTADEILKRIKSLQ